ncbi:MAG: type II toxin-antitoxin system RelB/DinJ family antitoxin [Firmicutes bacterium]|nr:type II toxin-antitoxin system RelB/DinJ family antitoxin [[Eubacterium] siraeum]MCM1488760.1 type II toxin-antitoxin system RelB/DinJ family antitoxin [Bacillota bacterium]
MAKVSTNISLDAEDKARAQEFLSLVGLDLSTAVGMFIKQMLREGRIPFEIRAETPNAETIEAMQEVEEFEKHPEKYKRYSSFAQLVNEVTSDA